MRRYEIKNNSFDIHIQSISLNGRNSFNPCNWRSTQDFEVSILQNIDILYTDDQTNYVLLEKMKEAAARFVLCFVTTAPTRQINRRNNRCWTRVQKSRIIKTVGRTCREIHLTVNPPRSLKGRDVAIVDVLQHCLKVRKGKNLRLGIFQNVGRNNAVYGIQKISIIPEEITELNDN